MAYKTPGVYIEEKRAFPNSVVPVETAVPVFIGYTKSAMRGQEDLSGKAVPIQSMADYERLFNRPEEEEDGDTPKRKVTWSDAQLFHVEDALKKRYFLHDALRMYFSNGGGRCYVISVGTEGKDISADALIEPFEEVTGVLLKEQEPTMVIVPDAAGLEFDDWQTVANRSLLHCSVVKSRIALLDVNPNVAAKEQIKKFRGAVTDGLDYGAAYYPWVHTNLYSASNSGPDILTEDAIRELTKILKAHETSLDDGKEDFKAEVVDKYVEDGDDLLGAHKAAMAVVPKYKDAFEDAVSVLNLMPPAAAMAGVIARTDQEVGVFKSPANTGILTVTAPAVAISNEEQEDLNVPITGKSVNAIRRFINRGTLVWGARTLDGNSQDWRYISVRRTAIMLEQSMKLALEPYVFSPNDAKTWTTVKSMLSNFLNNQWKAGALAGTVPEDAYEVHIGLGSTMTANDILDGYMRVNVKVAITRPAEFIVLTFQQKLQSS